jgi:hypothetical protein
MFRMAALATREAAVGFSDFLAGMRQFGVPALALGVASTVVFAIFTANIALGLSQGSIAGGVFALLALYADVALATYLVTAWPILVDPLHETVTVRARLRLAFYVLVTRLGRMLGLTIVILAILTVSTILFAALLTISVAYVSLVGSRYVLPAADRFEGRATVPIPTD